MKTKTLPSMKKRILTHVLALVGISFILAFLITIKSWDTLSLQTFFIYFLQGLSSIFLLLAPPIYANIYWLIPKYLAKKQYLIYGLAILVVIIGWGLVIGYGEPWIDKHWFNKPSEELGAAHGIIGMVFIILISTLLNLSYHWFIQLSKIKQIENDQLHLELAALKNQINPHFFFNTLNNLYALSLEKSEETPSLILKLSEMMRYTIYDCKAPKVSIGGEVSYLENFISLQKMRHHNRGHITFNKMIDEDSTQVAPMILIVFLENAFKHGFDLIENNAFIHMKLEVNNKLLSLNLENNFTEQENENQIGIGLENVKRRLSLIYPDAFSLNIIKNKNVFEVQLKLNLE